MPDRDVTERDRKDRPHVGTHAHGEQTRTESLFANAPLLLTATTTFWGGNAIAGKFAVGEISPLVLTGMRWWIASAILLCLGYRHLVRDWAVIRANALYLFALGAFGFAGFNGFLYGALNYTTAINVTILQAAMPMIIFLLNFLIFRTRLHVAQALGYSVTLMGVAVTVTHGDIGRLTSLELGPGDALMLIGAVIYASYSVALRGRPPLHWMSFLTVLTLSAAIAGTVMMGFEVWRDTAVWPTTSTAWSVIIYTVIFPSILGQAFFARAVELVGSNRASVYLNLVPIFGSLFAVLLLGETFAPYHAMALVLVIGGIAIAQNLSPKA